MKTNRELKTAALAALKDNWAPAVLGALCFYAVECAATLPSSIANTFSSGIPPFDGMDPVLMLCLMYAGSIISVFVLYPLTVGYTVAHNDLYVNGDSAIVRNTFRHAINGYFKNLLTYLLMYLFIALWTLLLFIPGIIKSLAYSLTPYIIKDFPELSANEAITLSMKMMKGYKAKLFLLMLSFIGWGILCIFTLGVGLLWLIPYMQTTFAAFYQDVKNEYLSKETAI